MKKNIFLMLIFTLLQSCAYKQQGHGRIIYEQDLKEVQYGKTSMLELMKILGSPSLEVDDKSWLYISTKGYKDHSGNYIHKKTCIKFIFNNNNIVIDKKEIELDDDVVIDEKGNIKKKNNIQKK